MPFVAVVVYGSILVLSIAPPPQQDFMLLDHNTKEALMTTGGEMYFYDGASLARFLHETESTLMQIAGGNAYPTWESLSGRQRDVRIEAATRALRRMNHKGSLDEALGLHQTPPAP